ncbi:MAG: ABC transporter permease [Clostridia bacterium]|nr:ABC transporter permease [Clostridia bacterium]
MNNEPVAAKKKRSFTIRNPFMLTKRTEGMAGYKSWGIRLIALLLAIVVCGLITLLITGLNPFDVYSTMFRGNFGTARKTWVVLKDMAILLCVSLAVTPAFKMRFWNIGGEGQILVGALATSACMILLGDKLPAALLIPIMFIAALAAGAIWGIIPAFFKAYWRTNETLFTLMMNYVALQLVSFFIIVWEVPKGAGQIGIINQSSMAGWLPWVGGQQYLLNVIIVAVLTALVYVYLKYTKHGYEISVVGESERTAKYIGIKVPKVLIRTMALSGALCALAGFLKVAGTDHTLTTTITEGYGFTAVMVSWMANFNPIAMIFTTFIIVFLDKGAGEIASIFRLNQSFSEILTGIILFFIIGCEFFIRYKISLRHSETKEA